MTSASVGFQCPECLREGRRTTRQPKRSTGLRLGYRAMPVTWTVMAINMLVWLAITVTGGNSSRLVSYLALRLDGYCRMGNGLFPGSSQTCAAAPQAQFVPGVDDGAVWQVLTSMFTHIEIWHIAVNMFSLYVLGALLEPMLGRLRYLAVYLVSGLAGSVLVIWVGDPFRSTVGASGALFGLMGLLVVMALKSGQGLQQIGMVLVLNLGITFWPGSGISWQAHVGGLVGGMVVALIATYGPLRRIERQPLQWAAQAGFACLLVVAVAVRILTYP